MKKILIVGAGYVGITVSVVLASFGHEIFLFDTNREKLDALSSSVIPFYEPGLIDLFKRFRRNIFLSYKLDDVLDKSDIIFVTVGTNFYLGKEDFSDYQYAITNISKHVKRDGKIIVIKSTIPIDAIEWTKEEIKKNYKGEISLVINPEFLREGNAIDDFLHPDRIVIGVEDDNARKELLELYKPIDAPKIITDLKTASMIKYISNVFLATKVSFINEVSDICELYGIDVEEAANAVGLDKRIGSNYLRAGIGFGGSCLPKDLYSLIDMCDKRSYSPKLIKAVKEVNFDRIEKFVEKIKSVLGNDEKIIGVWGLSFKANTDDIRESQSIKIIKQLLDKGYIIKAYDPQANKHAKYIFGNSVEICDDPLSAVKGVHALLVLTDWPQFKDVDLLKVKSLMKDNYIFDGRNLLDPQKIEKIGFKYFGIGRKTNYNAF